MRPYKREKLTAATMLAAFGFTLSGLANPAAAATVAPVQKTPVRSTLTTSGVGKVEVKPSSLAKRKHESKKFQKRKVDISKEQKDKDKAGLKKSS